MKEQEQRLAIAEACQHLPVLMGDYIWSNTGYIIDPFKEIIIDPINDLNAMHEAEKVLHQRLDLWWDYANNLKGANSELGVDGVIHATAAQRAEAFLKTLNLWK